MNKYYLLVSLFLSSSVMVSAGPSRRRRKRGLMLSQSQNGITGKAEENPNADRFYLDEA